MRIEIDGKEITETNLKICKKKRISKILGGVRHHFKDTETGIEARTGVEFPAICPKIILKEHQKHLAVEWSGWIQWAIDHQ